MERQIETSSEELQFSSRKSMSDPPHPPRRDGSSPPIGSGLTHRRRSRKVAPSNRACLQMLQADEQPNAAGRPVPRNKASPNAARSGPACIAADLVFADSATGASS